eukprot:TRINITY_DN1223_c0_g1_i2.p2 TRINITY_DN1223_c0_g1~~TRINITY_DN1223_c0_g1_i2.p2  ORF type:complete len:372 (+),score=-23.60 TRINITY_DN1223_c0_g1_i2:1775-2890(+)
MARNHILGSKKKQTKRSCFAALDRRFWRSTLHTERFVCFFLLPRMWFRAITFAAFFCCVTAVAEVVVQCNPSVFSSCLRFGYTSSLDGVQEPEGTQLSNGYQFWAETVNNQSGITLANSTVVGVTLVRYNDHSNVTLVPGLYQQLINEGVDFLFGPFGSSYSDAANKVANSSGSVIIHGAAGDYLFTKGYKMMFGVSTSTVAYATYAVDVLSENHANTVAIAHSTVLFGAEVAAGAIAEIAKVNMQLLKNVSFTSAMVANPSNVERILQELSDTGADVIMWLGLLADSELAVNASAKLGIKPKAFFLTSAPAQPDFVSAFGSASNYILGPTQWFPTVDHKDMIFGTAMQFSENYYARFNDNVTQIAAQVCF